MMLLVVAVMFASAAADTSAAAPRKAFSDCLKQAVSQAKAQKVGADAFVAFARTHCSATEAALKKAVMAIDQKNGVSRKQALENAEIDVNDYFMSTAENYEYEMSRSAPQQP